MVWKWSSCSVSNNPIIFRQCESVVPNQFPILFPICFTINGLENASTLTGIFITIPTRFKFFRNVQFINSLNARSLSTKFACVSTYCCRVSIIPTCNDWQFSESRPEQIVFCFVLTIRTKTQSVNVTQLFLLLLTKQLISLKGDTYSDNTQKKSKK